MTYRVPSLIIGFVLLHGVVLAQPRVEPFAEILKPSSNLDFGGIPPIPLALVRTVEPYGRCFGPEVLRWTDSGSGIYLKTRVAGIRMLRSEEPGAIPRFWQELGSSDTYDVYLSPDSRYAVFKLG